MHTINFRLIPLYRLWACAPTCWIYIDRTPLHFTHYQLSKIKTVILLYQTDGRRIYTIWSPLQGLHQTIDRHDKYGFPRRIRWIDPHDINLQRPDRPTEERNQQLVPEWPCNYTCGPQGPKLGANSWLGGTDYDPLWASGEGTTPQLACGRFEIPWLGPGTQPQDPKSIRWNRLLLARLSWRKRKPSKDHGYDRWVQYWPLTLAFCSGKTRKESFPNLERALWYSFMVVPHDEMEQVVPGGGRHREPK